MPLVVQGRKNSRIRFVSTAEGASRASSASSAPSTALRSEARDSRSKDISGAEEAQTVSVSDEEYEDITDEEEPTPLTAKMASAGITIPLIPSVFTNPPPIQDDLETQTSIVQEETMETCLPFLSSDFSTGMRFNAQGVPALERAKHIKFLKRFLRPLPGGYAAADAARPWFFYWCLNGLSLLGAHEEVQSYKEALIATAKSMQNATGGFAGGHGQMSHIATTYAVVLALAIVGGEDAFEVIDRKAMWEWLCILKQRDGGFQVSVGGEEDIRGAYCASVVISLLNLPLKLSQESPGWTKEGDTLLSRLPDYVSRCQTYEGGTSSTPNAEAHGAYAFCALGCLSVLGEPQKLIPRYLDVPRFVSWLSSRQYGPEAGFSGRTNKLVDGCYSHWVGGCWPMIEAVVNANKDSDEALRALPAASSIYSREGLIRYILCCCQEVQNGGLRDKPGKGPDSYHTCYVLEGLSSAQHKWTFEASESEAGTDLFDLEAAYRWTSEIYTDEVQIFDEQDRVNTTHPVFAIPEGAAERIRDYFVSKDLNLS